MRIYISHSTGCAGWDMPAIYAETQFANACRTMRYKPADRGIVKMLDWDYKEFLKRPATVKARHLEIIREDSGIEVVMGMDAWEHNIPEALHYADTLSKYCDRVLIPVHHFDASLLDHDLALPNANWFAKNVTVPDAYRYNITHLLGGSPHDQLHKAPRFPFLKSVDGNQIFNIAIRAGKYWSEKRPHWRKRQLTNEEAFRKSVRAVNAVWERYNPAVWPSLLELAREDDHP